MIYTFTVTTNCHNSDIYTDILSELFSWLSCSLLSFKLLRMRRELALWSLHLVSCVCCYVVLNWAEQNVASFVHCCWSQDLKAVARLLWVSCWHLGFAFTTLWSVQIADNQLMICIWIIASQLTLCNWITVLAHTNTVSRSQHISVDKTYLVHVYRSVMGQFMNIK